MPIKVDNAFATSNALRRYSKASQPFPDTGEKKKEEPTTQPEAEPGMDRVTLSNQARSLLTAQEGPQEDLDKTASTVYTRNALPQPRI